MLVIMQAWVIEVVRAWISQREARGLADRLAEGCEREGS